MASEVVMPRLGWTMETGSIVEWLKRDGEVVRAGELLFTIETDKAVNECEALDSGALRIPPDSPPPGTPVPIGTVLAYLVAPGELAPFEQADPPARSAVGGAAPIVTAAAAIAAAPTTMAPAVSQATARAYGWPTISPRARRVAAELGIDWMTLTGSGRTGRIVERDIHAAAATAATEELVFEPVRAARVSPLARRLAADAGVDTAALAASQPGARLTTADIQPAPALTPSPVPSHPAPRTPHPTPISGVRRLIAARLGESARTTVPVTLTTEADATRLAALRDEAATDAATTKLPLPTYTDLLLRLTAVALTEHPALNASLDGDHIVQHAAVHLGLAVDTERGLLVPVVRDAERKSVRQLAAETARLTAAARDGSIGPDELRGGTFTVTNLGMYEIDAFTPVINLPECAILGVGRIAARPVVVDEATGTIAVRKLVALSLTFDHRLVDGAPAARFLQRIKHLIERPTLWLF